MITHEKHHHAKPTNTTTTVGLVKTIRFKYGYSLIEVKLVCLTPSSNYSGQTSFRLHDVDKRQLEYIVMCLLCKV